MVNKFTLALITLLLCGFGAIAQVPFANANWVITLVGSPTNNSSTRTGVAYNPFFDLYYSNQAGNPTLNIVERALFCLL